MAGLLTVRDISHPSWMSFTKVIIPPIWISPVPHGQMSHFTDAFLTAFGAGQPSEETTDRISGLLTQLYANASYEASTGASSDDGTLSVQLTIRPLNILTDNYDTIQTYVHSFNEKNASFAYANLTEEAYYDTYLDGILTILESHLADMTFGKDTTLDITLSKNDGGLYTISEDTLTEIQNTILPWPEAEMQQ